MHAVKLSDITGSAVTTKSVPCLFSSPEIAGSIPPVYQALVAKPSLTSRLLKLPPPLMCYLVGRNY